LKRLRRQIGAPPPPHVPECTFECIGNDVGLSVRRLPQSFAQTCTQVRERCETAGPQETLVEELGVIGGHEFG
jgi:hypothetical protein